MAAAGVAHRVPLLVLPHPLASNQNHILPDEKTRNQPREEGTRAQKRQQERRMAVRAFVAVDEMQCQSIADALGPPFREEGQEGGTEEPLAAWVDSLGGHVNRD